MAKAKPFRWIGDVENRCLWLNLKNGDRLVISPGGTVKKEENLEGITHEWQKEREKKGLLEFLGAFSDAADGAVDPSKLGGEPLDANDHKLAQDTLSASLADSKVIEKNNKIKADKELEKAIDASDKREKEVAGNTTDTAGPDLGGGIE